MEGKFFQRCLSPKPTLKEIDNLNNPTSTKEVEFVVKKLSEQRKLQV